MLRIDISAERSPSKERERSLSDTGVDGLTILSAPYDECIILSNACEETVIRGECKLVDAFLHSLEYNQWLSSLVAPQDDWSIRLSLEDSSLLSCCNEVSRI